MTTFREQIYVKEVPRNIECLLAADIGGTNSNFGIFQERNGDLILLLSLHAKSQEVTDFTAVVADVLTHIKNAYDIAIQCAAFAASGVVSAERDYVKPTNVSFAIDANEIMRKTEIARACVVNDFDVIGYGIDKIAPEDLILVHGVDAQPQANKVIVGAGTGLGKTILTWDQHANRYVHVSSEGGHADLAAQSEVELALVNFIKEREQRTCAISWEDVLSGDGIKRIYMFFCAQVNKACDPEDLHPDKIFKSRDQDEQSKKTFELYACLYARCAKNFALDVLALGGVYIAGGIAANNIPMFQLPGFKREFINCGKMQEVLQQIPVYVIADYNVSLYGAAVFMQLEQVCQ